MRIDARTGGLTQVWSVSTEGREGGSEVGGIGANGPRIEGARGRLPGTQAPQGFAGDCGPSRSAASARESRGSKNRQQKNPRGCRPLREGMPAPFPALFLSFFSMIYERERNKRGEARKSAARGNRPLLEGKQAVHEGVIPSEINGLACQGAEILKFSRLPVSPANGSSPAGAAGSRGLDRSSTRRRRPGRRAAGHGRQLARSHMQPSSTSPIARKALCHKGFSALPSRSGGCCRPFRNANYPGRCRLIST